MHRCFAEPECWEEEGIRLSSAEQHHLLSVLRAADGESVGVFDGRGREALARVCIGSSRRDVTLQIESGRDGLAPAPETQVALFCCLLKPQRMDLLVEKATELGAARICPIVSTRSAAVRGGSENKRLSRWQRIAVSAAKQCGTAWLPGIDPGHKFAAIGAELDGFDLALVCSLATDAPPMKAVLGSDDARGARKIAIITGPEGDFTPGELQACLDWGARPVNLGPLVLRAETAVMFALSAVRYELG